MYATKNVWPGQREREAQASVNPSILPYQPADVLHFRSSKHCAAAVEMLMDYLPGHVTADEQRLAAPAVSRREVGSLRARETVA